jgi:hypothetical protein
MQNSLYHQFMLNEMDVTLLISHIRPAYKHDGQSANDIKKRLIDAKQKNIKYECYYTREWFSKYYDSDKTLTIHRMTTPRWKIVRHIEKTFNP